NRSVRGPETRLREAVPPSPALGARAAATGSRLAAQQPRRRCADRGMLLPTCRMTRSLLRAAALGLVMAAAALATDHPIEGDRLVLTDPSTPARRTVRFRAARDPAIDPRAAADPRSMGAILEIAGSGAGDGATGTISLDPGRWTGLGHPAGAAGYRWDDRAATNGVR